MFLKMVFGQPGIHMDENIASKEQYLLEQTTSSRERTR